jgi:diketogulonate reductase-like aldo/keto reductase
MKYKDFAQKSTKISAIGQGCMGIGGYLSSDLRQDEEQMKALRLGIEHGMTLIDTAEAYGDGHSEELVGRAIMGIRHKVFIATKFSPEHNSYDGVIKSAEESLNRFRTNYIDLYQVHWPNPKIPIAETMRAMERLLLDGKIRYIGVSNFSLKELKEAEKHLSKNFIASIQVEYNLFDRIIENNILPYCKQAGITIIAYSPLDQGRIASGDEKIRKLKIIADKYGKTMAQVALNWLIMHPSVIAIPKAVRSDHIKENASAADFELSGDDFKELCNIFNQEIVYVPTDRICVVPGGQGNRQVYQTIEEALENKLGFVPSPVDLAQDIRDGEVLKPVRVVHSSDKTGKYDYDLIEGRIRYWAWVIAHNGKTPIPVFIRNK